MKRVILVFMVSLLTTVSYAANIPSNSLRVQQGSYRNTDQHCSDDGSTTIHSINSHEASSFFSTETLIAKAFYKDDEPFFSSQACQFPVEIHKSTVDLHIPVRDRANFSLAKSFNADKHRVGNALLLEQTIDDSLIVSVGEKRKIVESSDKKVDTILFAGRIAGNSAFTLPFKKRKRAQRHHNIVGMPVFHQDNGELA